MDFYKSLSEIGKIDMLYAPKEVEVRFSTEDKVIAALMDIKSSNDKTLIYGDYDFDGASCIDILVETFNYVGISNYEVFKYVNRTHSIDRSAVTKAITEGFKNIIICDTGSAEPDVVNRLTSVGVNVIILDHHKSIYGYDNFPNAAMINTSFENRLGEYEYNLSAGALTYLVCDKFIKALGMPELESLAALALTSLYADSIDMSSDLNRGIYYKATGIRSTKLPKRIQHFMNDYTYFNRNFIEFKYAPKINSLFRSESFDLLNKYLFWEPQHGPLSDILDKIVLSHKKYREEVSKASDIIEFKKLDNFILGNLSSVSGYVDIPEDKLHNYTGLVANQLANRYKKTAVVYADAGTEIKCSVRDHQGRNYLELFQQFCNAGGHSSAFGIHVSYLGFSDFISYIELIDKQFFIRNVGNEPLIVQHNHAIPDEDLLHHIALYNEFSGTNAPMTLISKVWLDNKKPFRNEYYYNYKWGEKYISSQNKIPLGSTIFIKAFRGYDRGSHGVSLSLSDYK